LLLVGCYLLLGRHLRKEKARSLGQPARSEQKWRALSAQRSVLSAQCSVLSARSTVAREECARSARAHFSHCNRQSASAQLLPFSFFYLQLSACSSRLATCSNEQQAETSNRRREARRNNANSIHLHLSVASSSFSTAPVATLPPPAP